MGHGKTYLASRIPFTSNDTRTQQLSRIIMGGDIHKNPGPTKIKTPKQVCNECGKVVRSNQKALLCAKCKVWSHASCLGLNKAGYKFYSDCLDVNWTCTWCSLPFRYANLSSEETQELNISGINISTNIDNNNQNRHANKDPHQLSWELQP